MSQQLSPSSFARSLLIALSLLLCATAAQANPGLASAFGVRYPASATYAAAGCNTCHGGTTATFNAYGRDLVATSGTEAQRLAALEALDSDREGNSNLVEIGRGTQPGWCAVAGCDNNGRTPPAGLANLDPPRGQPPAANAGGPYTGAVNVAIAFNGAGSSDADGSIVSWQWNFGDGSAPASGATQLHSFAAASTYTVTLTVTDNDGLTATATTTATVSDGSGQQPPVARAGGPYTGSIGGAVSFDGSASSDPDGSIVSYDWRFGDGGTASGSRPTWVYAAAGTYTVELRVTDNSGRSGTATTTATIRGPDDGATLYAAHCAGCHGDPWGGPAVDASLSGLKRVAGARSCSISGAIGGTSVFPQGVPAMVAAGNRNLTGAQVAAIADYLNSRGATGEQRYVTACAGCHGNDGSGGRVHEGVRGEGAGSIREAIGEVHGMRYLSCLPADDVNAMAAFLQAKTGGGSDDRAGGGGGAGVLEVLLLAALGLARRRRP